MKRGLRLLVGTTSLVIAGAGACGESDHPLSQSAAGQHTDGGEGGAAIGSTQGGSVANAGERSAGAGGTSAGDSQRGGAPGAGAPEAGMTNAQGGEGGRAAAPCEHYFAFGTHRINVHNEKKICYKNQECQPNSVEDGVVTMSLFPRRDEMLEQGVLQATPGISLHPKLPNSTAPDVERWYFPNLYYPAAGEVPPADPRKTPSSSAGWDAGKIVGSWLGIEPDDVCLGDAEDGFAYVNVDLATGRVLGLFRYCIFRGPEYDEEYWLTGVGDDECDVVSCNAIENTAPAAVVTQDAPLALVTGGELSAGTYHLVSAQYPAPIDGYPACPPSSSGYHPSPITETLVISATNSTTGTISWVSDRGDGQLLRATSSYEIKNWDKTGPYLFMSYVCGDEVLAPSWSMDWGAGYMSYQASPDQLRLATYGDCPDYNKQNATIYTYKKQ